MSADMASTYDIFISYSNKDKNLVHGYAKFLEDCGYKVWYDAKGLYGGAKFASEIADAIEVSRLFVFFSSENSNDSQWTKGEIFMAQKLNKKILPVRIDDSEYEKSVMLILLPLQYISCTGGICDESLSELRNAIVKLIGKPSEAETSNVNETAKHRCLKPSLCFSGFLSLFFAAFMMCVSGEYLYNISLSLFSMTITALLCFLTCLCIVLFDRKWNERLMAINIVYLLSMTFFLSYSIMAIGLSYGSLSVLLLNYQSIICAAISICALVKLMSFKKIGYIILWVCLLLFAIGSYWWLSHVMVAPVVVAVVGGLCMLLLTYLLKQKHEGLSMWSRLK